MKIETAFKNMERIPKKYTCDGENINPEFKISDLPKKTKSLVLIMDDPDSPTGTWDHWILFNIDPMVRKIEENNVPNGAEQGVNTWGQNKYGGPCPGIGRHRYFFKFYALDKKLDLDRTANKIKVESAMKKHIIASSKLIGIYSRE